MARNSSKRLLLTLALTLALLMPYPVFATSPVRIATQASILDEYNHLMSHYGDDPLSIETIQDGQYHRSAIDLFILTKALHQGGVTAPLEFVITSNARRETEEVVLGNAVIGSQQFNSSTLDTPGYWYNLFVSSPITRIGDFEKGFYCLDTNTELLKATSAEKINRISTGVIGLHWGNDIRILRDIGIDRFITAPTFDSIVKMVIAGRADWIPLEIRNTENKAVCMKGHRFVPIPGIKFSLIESRHFLVSRVHPDGERIFNALEKGLAELRRQGFIRKALAATGFFTHETKDWKLLNEAAVHKARREAKTTF